MKRFISIMALLFTLTFTANAMSYEQARQQALFLTDKMAYELNLTDDQYEAAYEINLDYLMSVNTVDDLYGSYWRYRNLDLSYILLDWQYRAFCNAAYFYRPLYFSGGYWRFGIYARYPYRDYYYFHRPRVYVSYCGGHSWHSNHGRSWYHGRDLRPKHTKNHFGMRDGFNRGDYGRGNRQSFGNRPAGTAPQNNNNSFGNRNNRTVTNSVNSMRNSNGSFGTRESSTRVTVRQSSNFDSPRTNSTPRPTFTPRQSQPSSSSFGNNRGGSSSFGSSRGSSSSFGSSRGGSFGPSRSSGTVSSPSRGNSSGGNASSRGSFGSRR
ncbi:hypothetical protein [uncultured Prevotella sp.]|uniref:hypothetical protein n=1 Tax=uncultured Prevotella sp. TaxID=159272 RepID=UPI0026057F8D|nr:hypothetical protein [uncultured Prevotella sp.]